MSPFVQYPSVQVVLASSSQCGAANPSGQQHDGAGILLPMTLTITHVSARPTIDAYSPIVTDTETYRERSSQLQ